MIEKRRYPRIYITSQATLELESGQSLSVTFDNISISGLQICCDRQTKELIAPALQNRMSEALVLIELPKVKNNPFKAQCSVITVRRSSADAFYIGLKFTEFFDQSYHALSQSIAENISA